MLASRSAAGSASHRPGTADLVGRLCNGNGQVYDRMAGVAGPLREALRQEKQVLLDDVEFLQR